MITYVDLMSDVRWSEADHVARVESVLRSSVTHVRDHVMLRRSIAFSFYLFAQMLPAGPTKDLLAGFGQPLTPAALAELTAAAQVFLEADVLAAQARADATRLDLALDYEEAQAALATLGPAPMVGTDPNATRRAALQAQLAAASAATLALVALRPRAQAALMHAPAPVNAELAMYRGPARGLRNKIGHWAVCILTWSPYSHVELVIDGVCYSEQLP